MFQDLGVTPFMNLMAVLIPFLLSVAVFTKLAILEIYLPPPSDQPPESSSIEEDKLLLTITITERGLITANGNEIVSFIASNESGYDLEALSGVLQELKVRYPNESSAIILSKPLISYETLVSVMDVTRTTLDRDAGSRRTLFPNISLGEVQ
jgi:biopolymer transport protein ExbD